MTRIKTVLISIAVGLLAVASFLLGRRSAPKPARVIIPHEEVQKRRAAAEKESNSVMEQVRRQNSGKTVGELVDFLNKRAKDSK